MEPYDSRDKAKVHSGKRGSAVVLELIQKQVKIGPLEARSKEVLYLKSTPKERLAPFRLSEALMEKGATKIVDEEWCESSCHIGSRRPSMRSSMFVAKRAKPA
jgi:hypothetical protein